MNALRVSRVSRACALLAALAALAGCGSKASSPPQTPPVLFAYDRSAPLRFRDRGVLNRGYPVAVRDISYSGAGAEPVTGYLVVPPPGRGRRPAVIYLHGSGQDRRHFIVPAVWMAARGAIGLTIDSPTARGTGEPAGRSVERSRDLVVQNVVDLRRAVDLLRSRKDVDPSRIAFVGFSAGARTGAVLAGVEHRIKAFDLMSGGATPVDVYARLAPPQLRGEIRRALDPVDPLRWVGRARPSKLFFQNGRGDELVPRSALVALTRAGSDPKRIRWYAAGHGLNVQAYRDQLAWLSRELGLRRPFVKGTRPGP